MKGWDKGRQLASSGLAILGGLSCESEGQEGWVEARDWWRAHSLASRWSSSEHVRAGGLVWGGFTILFFYVKFFPENPINSALFTRI